MEAIAPKQIVRSIWIKSLIMMNLWEWKVLNRLDSIIKVKIQRKDQWSFLNLNLLHIQLIIMILIIQTKTIFLEQNKVNLNHQIKVIVSNDINKLK